MNDYIKDYTRARRATDSGLQRYMVKVYMHMTFGLLITAIAAAATFNFPLLTDLLFKFDPWGNMVGRTFWGYVVMFSPFFIAMYTSSNASTATISRSRFLLIVYAVLIGISFSELAFFYTIDSLHKTFLVTASTFAVMTLYGYTTKRNLTSLGSFSRMAFCGIIITLLLNIFMGSPMIDFVISFIGVIAFIGFVAYDTQKLKALYYELHDTTLVEKAGLIGAFFLYADFLNLFVFLLRFLGEQKRKD